MKRRINNIYDFTNYRLLLNTDFAKRVAFNQCYSLRRYAQDLDISVGFLSKVINGKKEFTHKSGREVFKKMGFNNDELDYIENIIILNTSKDINQKLEAEKKINNHPMNISLVTKEGPSLLIQNPETFIVYALIRSCSKLEDIHKITNQLNIPVELIQTILHSLLKNNFICLKKERYYVTDKDFDSICGHNNFCKFATTLAGFFYNFYIKQDITSIPANVASCLVLGLNDDTCQEAYELQKHYILTMLKISERSLFPNRFVFLNNLIIEKSIAPKQLKGQ